MSLFSIRAAYFALASAPILFIRNSRRSSLCRSRRISSRSLTRSSTLSSTSVSESDLASLLLSFSSSDSEPEPEPEPESESESFPHRPAPAPAPVPDLSSRANRAKFLKCSSLASFSLRTIRCCIIDRCLTSSLACRSAASNASDNFAKLSLILTSCNPLPSAANLLSSAIVYPLAFFQFEIHGGITHAFCSSTDTARGGECITGAGGEGGAFGILLCWNFGGSSGSTCTSDIRITRCCAPEL
ncbi:hypothetical protein AX774_g8222 [Zancudomyces culisetae]|uniref:Uncharacterized protein n=1 Tax=Zancudomyces culisetae TaxID=1213189 RepID=A0A1R1PC03_ZANCU|nr:hypothetical protein AX774_g8222 [Zancudomyces culisetae]|eukprot:OMH78392.1 hypothetical protein AX774_g8222 [Zancudomyces culisetae]